MRLTAIPLALMTLPALSQAPTQPQIGLRLTNASITGRGDYHLGTDSTSALHIQEVNPDVRLVPALSLSLPVNGGAVEMEFLYTKKADSMKTTLPAGTSATTYRDLAEHKDLLVQFCWVQPLVKVGAADFGLSFGLRYEKGTSDQRHEQFDAAVGSLGGTTQSEGVQAWGSTLGLQIHLGLGERTSLRSQVVMALMTGSRTYGDQRSFSADGSSFLDQVAYSVRRSFTAFNGEVALGVHITKGLEGSLGYEHRDLNGATFAGPFIGVNWHF
jgi:hypothetical protein